MNNTSFIFRKTDKVGVADASMDKKTLLENFIDTGDYDTIADFDRPERFILGRAGVGKTALIIRLKEEKENVILVEPESLSLGYISNSTIIQNLTQLGVDFGLFYRMLWRHVLVVEILKQHFGILDEDTKVTVFDKLKTAFSQNKQKKVHVKALEYMEKWGSSFWQETSYRIKEIKETIESEIKSEIGATTPVVKGSIGAGMKLTSEEKGEITHKAQEIVNSVQMKELSDLMKLLDDAIDDRQKRYYLVIDRLDEGWVDENIRYSLIMALIETIKDFEVVRQVKPMIVLRSDLLSRVYNQTRKPGFQEEKFASLNINVSWTRGQMLEMLDARINYLIKQRYTTQTVTHRDILPLLINGISVMDYMIDRTLLRPRDLIDFFNHCIEQAVDSPDISEDMLIKAERDYSRSRRSAIMDEWLSEYPTLRKWDVLLDSLESEFFIDDINLEKIEKLALDHEENESKHDSIEVLIKLFLEEKITLKQLRTEIMIVFYNVGYIGLELRNGSIYWPHETKKSLHKEELNEETIYRINPTFYSCFNIKLPKK